MTRSSDVDQTRLKIDSVYQYLCQAVGADNVYAIELRTPGSKHHQSYFGVGAAITAASRGGTLWTEGDRTLQHAVVEAVTERCRHGPMSFTEVPRLVRSVVGSTSGESPALVWLAAFEAGGRYINAASASNDAIGEWDTFLIVPSVLVRIDHLDGTVQTRCQTSNCDDVMSAVSDALRRQRDTPEVTPPPNLAITMTVERPYYFEAVRRALDHIAAGDVYQVQLGHEVYVERRDEVGTLYRRFRASSESPFKFCIHAPPIALTGASPELHVHVSADRVATMRPLAGTAPTSGGNKSARALRSSAKERAEHIMLVDLCRNDLGRVAAFGTVEVPQLFTLEAHGSVYHLASTVRAQIRQDRDCWDAVAAAFPAGTVTGAPKVSAVGLIRSLEARPRGVYSGCVAFIDSEGELTSALLIRTIVGTSSAYSLRASAGVVADSTPRGEWRETLSKMKAMAAVLTTAHLTLD